MKEEIKVDSILKLDILLLLHECPRHGYELIKDCREKMGKRLSPGIVYPFMKQLQKRKLVRIKTKGRREKKIYELTPKGKTFVKELLNKFSNLIELAVSKKIVKCSHCNCEIYSGAYIKKIGNRKAVFCCKACATVF